MKNDPPLPLFPSLPPPAPVDPVVTVISTTPGGTPIEVDHGDGLISTIIGKAGRAFVSFERNGEILCDGPPRDHNAAAHADREAIAYAVADLLRRRK